KIRRGGAALGAAPEGGTPTSCSQAGQSGLRVKPENGLGARLALGGLVAVGVAVPPRQSRRDRTTSRMRTTPTTSEKARSNRIISPSTGVVYGLIIPRLEPIRIRRTIDIHDPFTNVLLYKSTFVLQSLYFAKHLKSCLQSNQRHAIFIDSWILVLLYF